MTSIFVYVKFILTTLNTCQCHQINPSWTFLSSQYLTYFYLLQKNTSSSFIDFGSYSTLQESMYHAICGFYPSSTQYSYLNCLVTYEPILCELFNGSHYAVHNTMSVRTVTIHTIMLNKNFITFVKIELVHFMHFSIGHTMGMIIYRSNNLSVCFTKADHDNLL